MPVPPAPVVPAVPAATAPAAPAAPAVTNGAPPATDPPPANDLPTDPAALQAMILALRKENGADRTNAKQAAADAARNELAQTIGKALGLVQDETPIAPEALAAEIVTHKTDAQQARVELAVFRASGAAGGDPAALLDSTSFLATLKDVDPTDTAAITAAITAAVTSNPRLGAAAPEVSRTPAPNPAQGVGGSGAPDLDAQIEAARKAGDLQTVIALKQQRAAAALKTP